MSRFYSSLCENILFPLSDLITGRSIYKKLKFLEKVQYWPIEKLQDYQNKQLRKVTSFAYNKVPYYRKVFDERNLKADDIQTTDDLVKLPLLTKEIIRSKGINQFIYGKKEKLIKGTTSGSSGIQGEFYLSKDAQSLTYAAELLFFKWGGFRLGEKHLQTGITPSRGFEKSIKDFLFQCYYVSAFNLSDKDLERIYQLIIKKKIKTLIGYASSLYCIAKYAKEKGESLKLNLIISLGDILYSHYRKIIEEIFNCKVTDTYGCGEGFMIAGQCEHQNYHNCMPLLFIEIIDSKGNRVPDGKLGRVVLTRLDLNPMPLIRYELGDLAILSKNEKCKCGKEFRLVDSIQGRDTDIITTPHRYKLIVHFFTGIFEHEQAIRQFQVLQEKKDEILIKIIPTENFNKKVLTKIERRILKECNNDLKVKFKIVDNIPLTKSGKRRFVISKFKY